jgi:hypothetical protein
MALLNNMTRRSEQHRRNEKWIFVFIFVVAVVTVGCSCEKGRLGLSRPPSVG